MQNINDKAARENKSLDADICQPKVFKAAQERREVTGVNLQNTYGNGDACDGNEVSLHPLFARA